MVIKAFRPILTSPATLPRTAEEIPTKARVFDRSEALDRVEGDNRILHEIVELFLEGLPNMLAAISGASLLRDGPNLERAAHSLKGSAGSLGAHRTRVAAERLEIIGREADFDAAQAATADLLRETELLTDLLGAFLNENPV